ncbi:MAG: hypothetical protein KAT05_06745 [Spirochaetes bacterium]|nr:hypothetical protein [Spirochaetota bacterium]
MGFKLESNFNIPRNFNSHNFMPNEGPLFFFNKSLFPNMKEVWEEVLGQRLDLSYIGILPFFERKRLERKVIDIFIEKLKILLKNQLVHDDKINKIIQKTLKTNFEKILNYLHIKYEDLYLKNKISYYDYIPNIFSTEEYNDYSINSDVIFFENYFTFHMPYEMPSIIEEPLYQKSETAYFSDNFYDEETIKIFTKAILSFLVIHTKRAYNISKRKINITPITKNLINKQTTSFIYNKTKLKVFT